MKREEQWKGKKLIQFHGHVVLITNNNRKKLLSVLRAYEKELKERICPCVTARVIFKTFIMFFSFLN